MLRYMLVVLLYITMYCTALEETAQTDTVVAKLLPDSDTSLSSMNRNLNPTQYIMYVYGLPQQQKVQNGVNLIEKAASGYLITPGMGAHKLYLRKLPWNKARKICIHEGGHLAIINSISEEKILTRILEEHKIDRAWLGVHDLYEEGDWNTIMDEPLEATGYSKWTLKYANPQPDNFGGKQNCGVLQKEGGIDDVDCNNILPFFCKINF